MEKLILIQTICIAICAATENYNIIVRTQNPPNDVETEISLLCEDDRNFDLFVTVNHIKLTEDVEMNVEDLDRKCPLARYVAIYGDEMQQQKLLKNRNTKGRLREKLYAKKTDKIMEVFHVDCSDMIRQHEKMLLIRCDFNSEDEDDLYKYCYCLKQNSGGAATTSGRHMIEEDLDEVHEKPAKHFDEFALDAIASASNKDETNKIAAGGKNKKKKKKH